MSIPSVCLASLRLRLGCLQPQRGAAGVLADRLVRRADASTGGITGAASASAAAAAAAFAALAAAAWALSTSPADEGGISSWLSASATAACDAAEKEGVVSSERCISLAEFLANDGSDGLCWLSVNGGVYDVTAFLSAHPGGSATLLRTFPALSLCLLPPPSFLSFPPSRLLTLGNSPPFAARIQGVLEGRPRRSREHAIKVNSSHYTSTPCLSHVHFMLV